MNPSVPFNKMHEDEQPNEYVKLGLKVGVASALHPFEYAKVLMQIGFEPIPPVPGKSIFGQPVYVLPNIFTYMGHLKRTDGFFGLFRGLSPKLVGMILSSVGSEKLAQKVGLGAVEKTSKDDDEPNGEELRFQYITQLRRDLFLHTSGILISQPFHVVSVRMMAQYVGKETKYNSILGALYTVWKEEGILGLFSGVIPRLLADLLVVAIASSTTYLVHRHVLQEKESRLYFGSFNTFIWTGILYPFHLVSSCIIVSKSGLAAGRPPNMPLYNNWVDCFSKMRADGDLKRGSSIFFRYVRAKSISYNSPPFPSLQRYN